MTFGLTAMEALSIAGGINSLTGGGITNALGFGESAPSGAAAQQMADPFSQGPMIQRIYDDYVKKYNVNTNSPSTSSQNNGTGPSTVDQRPPY